MLTDTSTVLPKSTSITTTSLHHDYWADNVDKSIYDGLTKMERKRQENLYELIYTEKDYVQSLEYLQTVKFYIYFFFCIHVLKIPFLLDVD